MLKDNSSLPQAAITLPILNEINSYRQHLHAQLVTPIISTPTFPDNNQHAEGTKTAVHTYYKQQFKARHAFQN